MKEIKLKMCPLGSRATLESFRSCDEGSCAWWDGGMCAVTRIAQWYKSVDDDVKRVEGFVPRYVHWDNSGGTGNE